jgi:hypothetical protein
MSILIRAVTGAFTWAKNWWKKWLESDYHLTVASKITLRFPCVLRQPDATVRLCEKGPSVTVWEDDWIVVMETGRVKEVFVKTGIGHPPLLVYQNTGFETKVFHFGQWTYHFLSLAEKARAREDAEVRTRWTPIDDSKVFGG